MSLEKRALLIGVSSFDSVPPLSKAGRDVDLLASVLRSPDGASFTAVEELTGDAGRVHVDALRTAIERFIANAPSRSLLLLYVATHALVNSDGSLGLIASNYDPKLPNATQVPISFIADCLAASRASSLTVIFDTCFADAGAWDLFCSRKLPFAPHRGSAPEFCVIATTRSDDPAIDGAFAPVFAESLTTLDPENGEEAVSVDRLYLAMADPLKERFAQFARKWESASSEIPLGRGHRGRHVSATLIEDLYAAVHDKTLIRANGDPFDFIEIGRGRFGQEERVGIRIFQGSARRDAESVAGEIARSVSELAVQEAIIVSTQTDPFVSLRLKRTTIVDFPELRRRVHPMSKYLEKSIQQYEETALYRFDYYVNLRARQENDDHPFILDRHIEDWVTNRDDVTELIVLGDFGTGKTTTARRIF